MPKMLVDEGVEYEDGTPATVSQQAKVGAAWRGSELAVCRPRQAERGRVVCVGVRAGGGRAGKTCRWEVLHTQQQCGQVGLESVAGV